LKENNQHIGNIDISDIDWINRIGTYNILIGESGHHGKRIGYHASHLIINHAFNRLNLNKIQLGVQENNLRAIKLYKSIGFEVEGIARSSILTNGRYINALRMGLLHSEYKFDFEIL
jgi:RimJ/RimL family protein N-acetyltransferase